MPGFQLELALTRLIYPRRLSSRGLERFGVFRVSEEHLGGRLLFLTEGRYLSSLREPEDLIGFVVDAEFEEGAKEVQEFRQGFALEEFVRRRHHDVVTRTLYLDLAP